MASTPDSHPDSPSPEPGGAPEQVDYPTEPGREGVETPLESPGSSGGTAGTAGDNKVQDELDR